MYTSTIAKYLTGAGKEKPAGNFFENVHISVDFPFCLLYIEVMVRKITIFFIVYLFLNILNLFLIDKAFAYSNTRKDFDQVLGEISDRKNNSSNYQFTASYKADLSDGYTAEIKPGDARAANLKAFLRKYNSDLYNHTDKIIEVSDKYGFDYRLLPAIAMQESNLCHLIPENSFNCWGWGIYGTTVTRFDSYDDAIETVGKGIKDHYIDEGLVTASAIMAKYTPSSKGSWQHGVNTFMKALE
ncbi:hypothetical protein CO005_01865 [Candidatus Roizmanbacteria bacterium CG_4_8_14_3_um_filter_34_9]|uniref:Mannosyl-glycoprotein endo-beta-N-acetylglucosamidase-like domain-containing protein n=2 Tax=Candidatus Roizmaniibacteriota TaxID=1752723 RepID=A0A2M6YTQ2_9BACT|nr:MAG: hypothetical protein COT02_03710 [Candidatus Roizmanbacteria bacterium CG07_land_8_20_14_0_80_34_15]PIW73378.1 MAG: hypothetical protein CO005_01865 [Candidatus Roizmanbacteria bacterium CG_4_8_14_3_um_filter_34_9]